jgi:hypothetical protein
MRNDTKGLAPVLVLAGSIAFEGQLAMPDDQHGVNVSQGHLLGDLAEKRSIETDILRPCRFPVIELLGCRSAGSIRWPCGT